MEESNGAGDGRRGLGASRALGGRQDRTVSEDPAFPGVPQQHPAILISGPSGQGSERHGQAPYFPLPQFPHRAPTILDRKSMETPGPRGLRQTSPLFLPSLPLFPPPPAPPPAPLGPHPTLFFLAKTCHRHHHTRKEINK